MAKGKAREPSGEEDDVSDDEETKELRQLLTKKKLYGWKDKDPDFLMRKQAILNRYRPPAEACVAPVSKSRKFEWGSDADLYEDIISDCEEFEDGKKALLDITGDSEGKWQNDSITRGNLEWRRYEFVQDGQPVRWARLTKLQDGGMRVQEGRNILNLALNDNKTEVIACTCTIEFISDHCSLAADRRSGLHRASGTS